MRKQTEQKIREHLSVAAEASGYDPDGESLLTLAILVREKLTGEDLAEDLAQTGIEHWAAPKPQLWDEP